MSMVSVSRFADGDRAIAVHALFLPDLLRDEITVFGAAHRLFADHPLGEEIREGFIDAQRAEVAEHLGVESGVEEVKDRMFDPADILVDGHPVIHLLPVEPRLGVVMRRTETVEVPGGLDEGIHRVRFAPRRFTAARTGRFHERSVSGKR